MRRITLVAALAAVLGVVCLWVGRAEAWPPPTYPTTSAPTYPSTTHPTYPTSQPTYPSTTEASTTTSSMATTTTASTAPSTTTVTITPVTPPEATTVVPKKVWVCKYVGTPGVDERLKEGKQPISVSVNAIPNPPGPNVQIGDEFADAQGRSIVVGFDDGGPPPDITLLCPQHTGTTTTTEEGSTTTTAGSTTTTCPDCTPVTQLPGSTTTTGASTTTSTSTSTTAPPPPGATTTTVAGFVPPLPPPSGPTPSVDSLSIGSAASVCSRDVPFIDITFGNQPEFNGLAGTIAFRQLDGSFVESHQVVYQAGETVRLVYPGASFDPVTGEATDWPGWMLNADGFWVLDPSDASFRDGLIVEATLDVPQSIAASIGRSRPVFAQTEGSTVTATTTITYPPETAACNSPEGPFIPGQPPPSSPHPGGFIPTTGADAKGLLMGSLLILGGGGGLIFITRRRGLLPWRTS